MSLQWCNFSQSAIYDNDYTNFMSSKDYYALIPTYESSIANMIPNKTIRNNVCCTFANFERMIIPNIPTVIYDVLWMLCNQYASANRYSISHRANVNSYDPLNIIRDNIFVLWWKLNCFFKSILSLYSINLSVNSVFIFYTAYPIETFSQMLQIL